VYDLIEELLEVSGHSLHPNPQMQRYQILAAGETIDLVYFADSQRSVRSESASSEADKFGDGDASLLEAGSVTCIDGWIQGLDCGGNEVSYPSERVEYVHHYVDIPEINND